MRECAVRLAIGGTVISKSNCRGQVKGMADVGSKVPRSSIAVVSGVTRWNAVESGVTTAGVCSGIGSGQMVTSGEGKVVDLRSDALGSFGVLFLNDGSALGTAWTVTVVAVVAVIVKVSAFVAHIGAKPASRGYKSSSPRRWISLARLCTPTSTRARRSM